MTSTSDVIESLVIDAKPVRRLRPPALRALCWLLFAALILVLVAVGHGVRPDLMFKLRQPAFATGVAAALLTGVLAAMASFVVSIPGRSRRWLLLPAPALAAWISTIGYGCLTDWVSVGPQGMSLGETARCFATLAVTGIPLSLAMLVMLRHVARLSPAPVAMMGSLAVAAMTAAALSLFHPLDATVLILLWNFGVAALFLTFGGLYGKRLFEWVAR
ncbi:NrsF family protein [Rhodoferax sediminis]|uniref:DUF1109 domain-containing protein n=1 Tax=Rhodoferax sediminis TaxID=2509614 RepID=A0A515D7M3_9BURK|nr:DUF1109 domain-containing protein [Rhodoferax sediminis]QDL36415.1 DUF1109 domain-containing protein [Rhodoferax sediminis]